MKQENKNRLEACLYEWLQHGTVVQEFESIYNQINAPFLASVIEGAIQGVSIQKTRNDQMFSNQGVNENLFENKRVIEG